MYLVYSTHFYSLCSFQFRLNKPIKAHLQTKNPNWMNNNVMGVLFDFNFWKFRAMILWFLPHLAYQFKKKRKNIGNFFPSVELLFID